MRQIASGSGASSETLTARPRGALMMMAVAIAELESRGYRIFLRRSDRVSLSRQVRGRFTTVHVYPDGRVEYDVWDAPNY